MELPNDVLGLIREYSRPVTRPDWKRLHKFTHDEFGVQLFICIRRTQNVLCIKTFDKIYRVSRNQPIR